MANILTGYGKPSVLLPGSKGQIYVDKLTGDEYECKGERGYLRMEQSQYQIPLLNHN